MFGGERGGVAAGWFVGAFRVLQQQAWTALYRALSVPSYIVGLLLDRHWQFSKFLGSCMRSIQTWIRILWKDPKQKQAVTTNLAAMRK
jgi:hypothetical protein